MLSVRICGGQREAASVRTFSSLTEHPTLADMPELLAVMVHVSHVVYRWLSATCRRSAVSACVPREERQRAAPDASTAGS